MKILKYLLICFALILVVFTAFIAYLPSMVSTSKGKSFILSSINSMIPGEVKAEEINLAWRGPSTLKNIELYDAQGNLVAKANELNIHTSLWDLYTQPQPEPQINLAGLNATLIVNQQGTTNLERALSFPASKRIEGSNLDAIFLKNFNIISTINPNLNQLQLDAQGETEQNGIRGSIKLNGKLNSDLHLNLVGEKLPVLLIDQIVRLQNPKIAGLLISLLGNEMDVTLTINKDQIEQKVTTPFFQSFAKGAVKNSVFSTEQPLTLNLALSPENFEKIKAAFDLTTLPTINEPVQISAKGTDLNIPLDKLEKTQGSVEAFLSNLKFEQFDLPKTSFATYLSPKDPDLSLAFQSEGTNKNQPFSIKGNLVGKNFSSKASLEEMLAETTTFNLAVKSQADKLDLMAMGDLTQKILTLKGDVKVEGKGGAENFLLKTEELPIEKIARGDIKQITFPFSLSISKISGPKRSFSVPESNWIFNGKNDELKGKFLLAGSDIRIDGTLNAIERGNHFDFSLVQKQGLGNLNLKGQVHDSFKNERSISIDGDLKDYSVQTLLAFLPLDKEMQNMSSALFGQDVSGTMHASLVKMEGPFSLRLKGERVSVDLEGQTSQGQLFLVKPLRAEVILSKEVSDHFLSEIVPLLDSAVRSDEPVKLTISNQGFSIPLNHITADSISMPSATLELGKVYFTREGKLAEVLSLLKISESDLFTVWFTPVYFQLKNGQLNLNRVDLLVADNYPIATWGSINFIKDYVDMEVGLTGRTLSASFGGIPLPKKYMLALPLRGSVNNPKLDKTKVAAKLASLAAMATGPQGVLVGGLIQLASGTFTDTIPEPTTKPLPWDTEAKNATEETSPQKVIEKPVKQIKKSAEKLINNIFGQ